MDADDISPWFPTFEDIARFTRARDTTILLLMTTNKRLATAKRNETTLFNRIAYGRAFVLSKSTYPF